MFQRPFLLGLAIATGSFAASPVAPALSLSDGTNTITIDSSGNAPVCSGSCSTSSYSAVAGSGQVTWSGVLGGFTLVGVTGQTKPVLSSPTIDLGIASVAGGASGGTLTASFTDTGFAGSGPFSLLVLGNGTGSFTAYADNSNAAFGQGITIGNSAGGFSSSNLGPSSNPFSLTNVAVLSIPAGASQNIDFGSFGTQGTTPGVTLTKTASPASVTLAPGQPFPLVTFTYTVTNTGGTTLTNIVVTDDNGTPSDKSDDFTVGTIASLAPGASQTLTWATYPPMSTVILDSTLGAIPGGSLTVQNETLPAGCIPNKTCWLKVVLNQALTLNDNSYGTSASSGWGSKGHKFDDLVGSDQAWFAFYDTQGNLVLETDEDDISQASAPSSSCPNQSPSGIFNSSYPSDYGTLGWCGGDGQFISGTSSYVIAHDSTITDNLNQSSAFYGYTTNSPASTDPNLAKWNLVDGYTVVIDPAAFGSNGFGWVTIPLIHNSPSMNGTDQISPVPASSTSTNTATLTADGGIGTSAQATVTITSSYSATAPSGGGGPAPPAGPGGPVISSGGQGTASGNVTVAFPAGPAANGAVGTSYSAAITATGGTAPYKFTVTAGALPAGLTLNSSTGVISGTPTAMTGGPAATITIQVTDSKLNKGSVTGNINITAPPPIHVTFPGGPAANGTIGTPYNASFTATGGAGAYTFSIMTGMLPMGLTLNASTGAITGTPSKAASGPAAQLTVKVVDGFNDSATVAGAININPPAPIHVTFPGGPAANGTVGTPYSASFTATGGLGAYTFSITAGSLPVGLTLNTSTGAITGTPTVAVSGPAAQLTVEVMDAYGDSATASGAINIAAAAPAPPTPPTPPGPAPAPPAPGPGPAPGPPAGPPAPPAGPPAP